MFIVGNRRRMTIAEKLRPPISGLEPHEISFCLPLFGFFRLPDSTDTLRPCHFLYSRRRLPCFRTYYQYSGHYSGWFQMELLSKPHEGG